MIYKRNSQGRLILSEFVDLKNLTREERKYPITQVSCVCYNYSGKILIVSDKSKKWTIPGGKPKGGESLEETAKREVLEEACVKIKNLELIGFMKVHIKNNLNKIEGENFLQARFIVKISKILDSREDPATGNIFRRKFISPSEFIKFIKWPEAKELIKKVLLHLNNCK